MDSSYFILFFNFSERLATLPNICYCSAESKIISLPA